MKLSLRSHYHWSIGFCGLQFSAVSLVRPETDVLQSAAMFIKWYIRFTSTLKLLFPMDSIICLHSDNLYVGRYCIFYRVMTKVCVPCLLSGRTMSVYFWWSYFKHFIILQYHSFLYPYSKKYKLSTFVQPFHSYESFQTIPALLFINRKVLFQPNLEILKLKWSYSSLYWPWGS